MRPPRGHLGFSLVELVIVVVIIAVVAAVAVPRLGAMAERSRIAAAITSVRSLQTKIDEVIAIEGDYPTVIEKTWFGSGQFPENPYGGERGVEVDSGAGEAAMHPGQITIGAGREPFWYNPANGVVRARVAAQASPAETMMLYRQVNGLTATNAFTRGAIGVEDGKDGAIGGAKATAGGGLDAVLPRR